MKLSLTLPLTLALCFGTFTSIASAAPMYVDPIGIQNTQPSDFGSAPYSVVPPAEVDPLFVYAHNNATILWDFGVVAAGTYDVAFSWATHPLTIGGISTNQTLEVSTDGGATWSDAASGINFYNYADGTPESQTGAGYRGWSGWMSGGQVAANGTDAVQLRFVAEGAGTYSAGGTGSLTLVPEPASLALVGLGGLLMIRRRR